MDASRDLLPYSALPRAPGLPLIGAMPNLMWGRFDYLDSAREQCGDIFVLDLGINEIVVVADAHAVEDIFVHRSKSFSKGGGFWEQGRLAVGNGLALSEGELWRRQRRLMNPEFRRARIAGFRTIIAATVDELLVELEREAGRGEAFDISVWTAKLLSTLTVRILFGSELNNATFVRLRDALGDLLDGVLAGVVTRSLPSWVPVPGGARFEAARQTVDEIVLGVIAERRRSGDSHEDLLNMLLHAADDDGTMSDQQLRDEVVITYVAGYETTAWALAWGLRLLADHPASVGELQAALADEAQDPLALPLLDATFREILRLYPSAPFLPRRALEDEQLLGYRIPVGTDVVVLPWLVHRNPKYWAEPTRFDPCRHLDGTERPRMAWMPFGGGQRLCIGMGLAMMEAGLTLGALLRRFTPLPATRRSEPRLSATLGSRDGVWIRLARR